MINFKLEDAIKKALEGKSYGNNKVIVETDISGQVLVYDYEEDDKNQRIAELEEEISELKTEIEVLEETIEELEEEELDEK